MAASGTAPPNHPSFPTHLNFATAVPYLFLFHPTSTPTRVSPSSKIQNAVATAGVALFKEIPR